MSNPRRGDSPIDLLDISVIRSIALKCNNDLSSRDRERGARRMPRTPIQARPENRFAQRRRRNREALLEAAIDLFQQTGVRGAKLEDLCARADVSTRTFFNHFETREHLYQALAQQRAAQFATLFDAAAVGPGSLRERLPALFAQIASYLDARPLYRELVGEMLSVRTDGASEVVRSRALGAAARRFVERAVERGEISGRPGPEVLADILLGALTTALCNWSASDSYALPRELERAAEALLILFTGPLQDSAA
jgi:AcrR family transcriptional regulator